MCVSCNQSISYGDIQDLKTGCFIKQNPARGAGFLFEVAWFRFVSPIRCIFPGFSLLGLYSLWQGIHGIRLPSSYKVASPEVVVDDRSWLAISPGYAYIAVCLYPVACEPDVVIVNEFPLTLVHFPDSFFDFIGQHFYLAHTR